MKDHREAVVCDFQNKATVDQTIGGLQTTVTQTSQMKILHSLKKQRHLLSQTVVLLPIQWFISGFQCPCQSLQLQAALLCAFHYKIWQPRFLYEYMYKKKHCSNNLYGYWDNFTALTTFNKKSIRHSFTVGTGLSYGWHKMAAGKLWLSSLCHPGDPANPPGHHLTTHQEECAETLYWRLNTHTAQLPATAPNVPDDSRSKWVDLRVDRGEHSYCTNR